MLKAIHIPTGQIVSAYRIENDATWEGRCKHCQAALDIEDVLIDNCCPYCSHSQGNNKEDN